MTTLIRHTEKFVRYLRHTRAVSALEYAVLVGLIATVVAVGFSAFADAISDFMEALAAQIARNG